MTTDRAKLRKEIEETIYDYWADHRYCKNGCDKPEKEEGTIDRLLSLFDTHAAARELEGRVEENKRWLTFNGAKIHDCGRRVDNVVHHTEIIKRLAELKEAQLKREDGDNG